MKTFGCQQGPWGQGVTPLDEAEQAMSSMLKSKKKQIEKVVY